MVDTTALVAMLRPRSSLRQHDHQLRGVCVSLWHCDILP